MADVPPGPDQLSLVATKTGDEFARASRTVGRAALPLDEKVRTHFWESVIMSPGCWFWVGAISSPDGYGRITWRRGGQQRSMSAHRFAMSIAGGTDIDHHGGIAEHVCNEPLCVRVDSDHVKVSTQARNLAYAVRIGRHQGPRPTSSMDRVKRSRLVREWLLAGGDPQQLPSEWHDDDQLALF